MKVKDLKVLLDEFDDDLDVIISDSFYNCDRNILRLDEVKDTYGEGSHLRLCYSPECLEDVNFHTENTVKRVFIYDSFDLYESSTGDYVNYSKGSVNVTYPNKWKENGGCDDDSLYESGDFLTVGGLRKFFAGVPEGTPVNIKVCGLGTLRIDKIRKSNIEYLCGTIDNVDYYTTEELFLIPGVELYGGEILPIKKWDMEWSERYEIYYLIGDTLQLYDLNLKGNEKTKLIQELFHNLVKCYYIFRRVNGSTDSNGLVHLYDENIPFIKYSGENKKEED